MNPVEDFDQECRDRVAGYRTSGRLLATANDFMDVSAREKYSYNFSWLGRPIIQYPQDIVALQEIIWRVQPDLVVETGVAHGGSAIFYASMMELLGGDGIVVGIDIDIRAHNREAIEKHRFQHRIRLIEGSSTEPSVVEEVQRFKEGRKRVLVVLDSNHTHEHVQKELMLYSSFVSVGSYCIVMDTIIEDVPEDTYPDRPWGKGDNPKTAVRAFLESNRNFAIDEEMQSKLLITVAKDGYLKRLW